jgi:endonuclease YncB( thermonuclease family)
VPELATGRTGSLQLAQGRDASSFAKQWFQERLTRLDGSKRRLFVRMADRPFDDNGRLLAYVAPNYTETERRTLTRTQRATFNLDLVEAGHAAPFIIYSSVPGELDLPLLLAAASTAVGEPRGIWANAETLDRRCVATTRRQDTLRGRLRRSFAG